MATKGFGGLILGAITGAVAALLRPNSHCFGFPGQSASFELGKFSLPATIFKHPARCFKQPMRCVK